MPLLLEILQVKNEGLIPVLGSAWMSVRLRDRSGARKTDTECLCHGTEKRADLSQLGRAKTGGERRRPDNCRTLRFDPAAQIGQR